MSKSKATHRKSRAADEWDHQWRLHWSRVGPPGCELPDGGAGGEERDFLAHARTPAKEGNASTASTMSSHARSRSFTRLASRDCFRLGPFRLRRRRRRESRDSSSGRSVRWLADQHAGEQRAYDVAQAERPDADPPDEESEGEREEDRQFGLPLSDETKYSLGSLPEAELVCLLQS